MAGYVGRMADSESDPKFKLFGNMLVPENRLHERTQGCWNCKHMVPAKDFWNDARQRDLQTALGIANDSLLGEQDPKAKNIRHMIDTIDHQVASGQLVRCGKNPKGKNAMNEPVGDLVANAFLCNGWSAAQGASVARAGAAPDKLPEELIERLDGMDGIKKRPLN